ncbi:hypothetical protein, partial [Nocardia beijingensis]|uniref:hypothetical protein n=1 Tax=Nocardia beijingensis TaxID=95162 RepID=UPI001C3FCE99
RISVVRRMRRRALAPVYRLGSGVRLMRRPAWGRAWEGLWMVLRVPRRTWPPVSALVSAALWVRRVISVPQRVWKVR